MLFFSKAPSVERREIGVLQVRRPFLFRPPITTPVLAIMKTSVATFSNRYGSASGNASPTCALTFLNWPRARAGSCPPIIGSMNEAYLSYNSELALFLMTDQSA